jgi:competence protein ComEC
MNGQRHAAGVLIDACFDVNARLFVLLSLSCVAAMAAAAAGQPWLLWPLAAIGIACGAWRRSLSAGFIISALPVLAYGYVAWRLAVWEELDVANLCHVKRITFYGRVLKVDERGKTMQLEVAVQKVSFPPGDNHQGVVLVSCHRGEESFVAGDFVVVASHLTKPKPAAARWEFDYAGYLRRRGILSMTRGKTSVQVLPRDQRPDDAASCLVDQIYLFGSQIDQKRSCIIDCHRETLGCQLGDLLSAIVIGNRAVRPPAELLDAFRNVGLSHLLAASGFNLTIASGALFFLATRLCAIDLVANGAAACGILVFVFLAGASPSVSRAAMMCSASLLLRGFYRAPHMMAVVSAALLFTVALDPLAVTDIGLQLSYAAAAGIVLFSSHLSRFFRCVRLPQIVCDCLAVILAAQISVLPILLYHFWQVGALFLLANLVVAPVVAPITVMGFVSSLCACLEPVHSSFFAAAWLLDWLVKWPLQFLILVAQFFASHKGARVVIGPPSDFSIAIYYGSLLLCCLAMQVKRWRAVAVLALLLSCLALFWRPPLPALTVMRFPGCTVSLTCQRKARVDGPLTPTARRYLTCHGVNCDTDLVVNAKENASKP